MNRRKLLFALLGIPLATPALELDPVRKSLLEKAGLSMIKDEIQLNGRQRTFGLSSRPQEGSATVYLNGVAQSSGWAEVKGGLVTFTVPPSKLDVIQVSYSYA